MVQNHDQHLAAAILSDGRVISYRLLSRELKVHANVAKRILYDFHQKQNAKKPSSVHATYLLDGIPKPIAGESEATNHRTDEEDAPMQSSPFTSSAVQQEDKREEFAIPSRSIILAREEDLEAAKGNLETLHSIHVYSLQPNTLQNLQSLSDCNRTISTTFNTEDPLVVGQQYGVIQNRSVRRRTARRPLGVAPSVAAAEAEKVTPKPSSKIPDVAKTAAKAASLPSQDSNIVPEAQPASKPSKKTASKVPALRKEKSDIFKSFAKPKSTMKKETTDSSAVESPAPASQESAGSERDQRMEDMSDGEREEGFVPENKADPQASNARSQRAEQLRKMMDEEDEEMEDAEEAADPEPEPEVSQASAVTDDHTTHNDPTPEPAPTVSGGRRRGRRKIMKKKTTKDEEGYLVTREEPAWESFSEDEPDPHKERAPVSSAASSKAKKAGSAKPGQGNIMSFFGKR